MISRRLRISCTARSAGEPRPASIPMAEGKRWSAFYRYPTGERERRAGGSGRRKNEAGCLRGGGEESTPSPNLTRPRRPGYEQRRMDVDCLNERRGALDRQASRLGVTRAIRHADEDYPRVPEEGEQGWGKNGRPRRREAGKCLRFSVPGNSPRTLNRPRDLRNNPLRLASRASSCRSASFLWVLAGG